MGVTIKQDNVGKLVAAVKALTSKETLIGVPATTTERPDGPFTNAAIGYLNEVGSPLQNIPPRPHLVPGVERAMPDATEHLRATAKAALTGDLRQVDAGFTRAGLVCEASVKLTITDVLSPALSPSTIEARKRKGHAGESPLIDTGQYLQSITHVVREK